MAGEQDGIPGPMQMHGLSRDTPGAGTAGALQQTATRETAGNGRRNPPPDGLPLEFLGVRYLHTKTEDGGDLYLTSYGLPFWEHLLPENWYAKEWFEANRERLVGTSTVYRVPTRPVCGSILDLVVKWSRVGEDVPVDTFTINKFINCDFNSPFEEFSLVMELRAGEYGPKDAGIRTQRPLAVYVPSDRLQLWETGRSKSKIAAKIAQHPGVELDILRQYVLLYGWIKGVDVVEASARLKLNDTERELLLTRETERVIEELNAKGFRVIDIKPEHIIVRLRPDSSLVRERSGKILYALIDYELLERTPEHERAVRSINRERYLKHMARRFDAQGPKKFPPNLKAANVMGVDYVFGHAESTGGLLWVVGKDPDLFSYFLPERWRRTPRTKLSLHNSVFYTRTKDNIHLVWKISHLGERPPTADEKPERQAVLDHGYNCPFEEFAYALELARKSILTVYPRAIYMTGHKAAVPSDRADGRRYETLKHILTPEGEPAIRSDHDYITIWGYWNGPDEALAAQDLHHFRSINGERACLNSLVTERVLTSLLERTRTDLAKHGFEDLNLRSSHLLLSISPDDRLVVDGAGQPEARLCNLELVRRTADPQMDPASGKA